MSLGPGMRTQEARPGRQALVLVLLALGSALLSNALAGPTRRLSWVAAPLPPPRPTIAPAPVTPAPPPAPTSAPSPASTPAPVPAAPRPVGSAPVPAPAPPTLRDAFPPPADGAPIEISDAEALALHKAGASFLDARRTAIFEAGHIAGARLLCPWEDGIEARVQAFADGVFDPKDPVVIYCSGGDCRDSHLLSDRLWSAGLRNLRIFRGGWPAWQTMKGPSATGPEAKP